MFYLGELGSSLPAKRQPWEAFGAYKERMRQRAKDTRNWCRRGRLIWDPAWGPYRKYAKKEV
jgi:hypothetical protein